MDKADLAVATFKEGFSCSQAVFSACSASLGLDRELALKIAGAFGGGMGRMGETCGAVTGAFMAIGLKYGKAQAKDDQAREKTYELVREFVKRFKARRGSIVCKELLGYDISTPEGAKIVREQKISANLCPQLVRDAVEILDEIL